METLSAVLQVYNEELCLDACLGGLLPVVDQCVIVHGSERGLSTDNTKGIIDKWIAKYGEKIVYEEGVFCKNGDEWDNTAQSNRGLELATGDFIMRTHADLIYDIEEVSRIREVVERFPNKKYFYGEMIDFLGDTEHIALPGRIEPEPILWKPVCGDPVVVSRAARPRYADYIYKNATGNWLRSGMQLDIEWAKDTLYIPHLKRFHYAFVKPFPLIVAKLIRNIMKGDLQNFGIRLKCLGERHMYEWAIKEAESYINSTRRVPYAGEYPKLGEPMRCATTMDGHDDYVHCFNDSYTAHEFV